MVASVSSVGNAGHPSGSCACGDSASEPGRSLAGLAFLQANQHGRFRVTNLPPGEYFADDVPIDDLDPDVEWLRRLAGAATRVELQEEVPLTLTLTAQRR
jgi:hypothetical protein